MTVWNVCDKKLADALYGREGPLSTFFMVTTLATAMQLIDKDQAATLATLRRVRNAFAHARSLVRFTTAEVEVECKKLWAWGAFEGTDLQGFSRARAAYIYAAMDLNLKVEQRRTIELEKLRDNLQRAEIVKAIGQTIRSTNN